MKNILKYWLELGVDGIRIDALKHLYERQDLKDEPIIDKSKPASYYNMNHIYTVDQNEVYDVIKEWNLILDNFTRKSGTTRLVLKRIVVMFILNSKKINKRETKCF